MRSLRSRLVVIFAVGSALTLLLGLGGLYALVDLRLRSALDTELSYRSADLAASISVREGRIVRSDPLAQLYTADGTLLAGSPSLSGHRLLSEEQVRFTDRPWRTDTETRIGHSTGAVPLRVEARRVGTSGEVLAVAASRRVIDRASLSALVGLVAAAPLLIVALSGAGWLVVRAALRPVDSLTREAASISSFDHDRRLPRVAGDDEIARLAATLNGMLERLHVAFERERAFVDDASHELRTPIAVLRGELELALTALDDPAEVEQSLRAAQTQAVRLTRLAEDLLLLADDPVAVREPVDLLAFTAAETPALGRVVGLRIETTGSPVEASVDADRLRQVFTNLAGNSAAAGAGNVRVTIGHDDAGARIEWADDGPGFPPALLGSAFDRFVRGDAARARGTGAGLGLSIVRAIVTAHGGTVQAGNGAPLGGAVVTVRV
ncbi:sensor histidine kinase [Cryptosporangium arvum]|uniref:sensor histidine kinase n=1 Tax=Cryptosporangium arvum TaxID=80871 RepID=UPI0004B9F6EF|nr:ATP-binding protein [Cryptosporangium arvum]